MLPNTYKGAFYFLFDTLDLYGWKLQDPVNPNEFKMRISLYLKSSIRALVNSSFDLLHFEVYINCFNLR